ncbi:hypothetical protein MKEN_01160900 [Mycena kentingensis (nom. inval.)]|nr:hypothetical protein MKEN_01160900 [Mycena kentingensis (nom. inval.)]
MSAPPLCDSSDTESSSPTIEDRRARLAEIRQQHEATKDRKPYILRAQRLAEYDEEDEAQPRAVKNIPKSWQSKEFTEFLEELDAKEDKIKELRRQEMVAAAEDWVAEGQNGEGKIQVSSTEADSAHTQRVKDGNPEPQPADTAGM